MKGRIGFFGRRVNNRFLGRINEGLGILTTGGAGSLAWSRTTLRESYGGAQILSFNIGGSETGFAWTCLVFLSDSGGWICLTGMRGGGAGFFQGWVESLGGGEDGVGH